MHDRLTAHFLYRIFDGFDQPVLDTHLGKWKNHIDDYIATFDRYVAYHSEIGRIMIDSRMFNRRDRRLHRLDRYITASLSYGLPPLRLFIYFIDGRRFYFMVFLESLVV